jgi:hypothetical protein
MRYDEIVETLVVIDEASPMFDMSFVIVRSRLQAFVLRHEILVFAEQ